MGWLRISISGLRDAGKCYGLPMIKKKFINESFSQTLTTDDVLSGLAFATMQADYSLSAADYMQLKNGWVSAYGWAMNIGFATFGYTLSIYPKLYASFLSRDGGASQGELTALGIGVGLVVLLCLLGLCLPSEKKKIMKEIHDHFKTAPKSRHPVRV